MEKRVGENGIKKECVVGFLKRNFALFFAPLFVCVLYFIQIALYGVYPFGNYTVASYDLSAQICPFIEHLFDVIDGRSSLFYSHAVAGGADVFGSLAYFIISPFSVLFLFFGDGNVANAAFLVVCLKLMTIAFSGAWFSRKLFKNIPSYVCAAVGIVYAYCGYTFVSNTYINWMDFLIYAPFGVAAFARFCKTGKFLRFSILLACAIYTCFSIVCFSFFTLFPALVFYAFLCVEKEERSKFVATLCLSFLVAVLISLPLLLPSFIAYLRSGRSGGIFENVLFGLDGGLFGKFSPKEYFESYSISLYRKWTYIFTDAIFVLLTLLYLIKSRLKSGLSKFLLLSLILTLLPLFVDEAMLLLNMGSYMSYALRFGFLNAVLFLGGACLALDGIFEKKETLPLQESVDGAQTALSARGGITTAVRGFFKSKAKVLFTLLTVAVVAFLAYFTISGQYWEIWGKWLKDEDGLNAERFFSSSFAHSLGGLPTIVVFFIAVAIVFFVGALLIRKRKLTANFVSWLLLAVLFTQVVFFNEQLVLGNRSTQHTTLAEFQSLCRVLDEREDGYYRVKDVNDKVTTNAPFTTDSNAFSVFSSVIDEDNFELYKLFGFSGNGKNSLKTKGGGVFANAFVGNKYYFYHKDNVKDAAGLSYLKAVKDESGEKLSGDTFSVYENEIVFPLAYKLPRGDFRFIAENTSENRTVNQMALYQFLGGTPYDTVRAVNSSETRALSEKLWKSAAELQSVGGGKITASVTASEGECLFLSFVASKGYEVKVNGKRAELIDNDLHLLAVRLAEGENVVEFSYSSPYVGYVGWGLLCAVLLLTAIAVVLKKTRVFERSSHIVEGTGIFLAVLVTCFFMVFPTVIWLYKLIRALLMLF